MSTFGTTTNMAETHDPSHRFRRLNKDTGLSAESKTSAPHGNMYQRKKETYSSLPNPRGEEGSPHGGNSARRITGKRGRGNEHESTNLSPRKRIKTDSTNGSSLNVPTSRKTLTVNIPDGTFYNNTGMTNRRTQCRSRRRFHNEVNVSECTRFSPSENILKKLGKYVAVRVYCDTKDPQKIDVNVGMQESMKKKENNIVCAHRGLREEFCTRPTMNLVPLETHKFPPLKSWGREKEVSFFSTSIEDLKHTNEVAPTKGINVDSKSIVYISTNDIVLMENFLRSWDPYRQAETTEQQHCVGVGFVYAYELWDLWHPNATVPSHHARPRR